MPQLWRTGFPYVGQAKNPARRLRFAHISLEVALLDLRLPDDRNRRRARLNLPGRSEAFRRQRRICRAMRLFRQPARGDWGSAFRDMAVELDAILSGRAYA